MRYAAAEKLEIIELVERSSLPIPRSLAQLGIPKSTFCAWYRNYLDGGPQALEDRKPTPRQVWNRVPAEIGEAIVELALDRPEHSPWELAAAFTDQRSEVVEKSTTYRLLKARDLITSPATILMQAVDHFSQPTTAINSLWQTDFTYLKVIGWGWFCLSTVLDDFSRYSPSVEVVHDNDSIRCIGHVGIGSASGWPGSSAGAIPPATVERQWALLHRLGVGPMA